MRTTVNPGRWLELVASLELVFGYGLRSELVSVHVRDRESGEEVTLAHLLEQFRQDPTDDVIGAVRITIEPAPPSSTRLVLDERGLYRGAR